MRHVDVVAVHFKKGKSVYTAKLYLELKREHLSIGAEEFDFKTTLDGLTAELYTLLGKRKGKLKYRKGRKKVEE